MATTTTMTMTKSPSVLRLRPRLFLRPLLRSTPQSSRSISIPRFQPPRLSPSSPPSFPNPSSLPQPRLQFYQSYSTGRSTGKSEPDLLVEELQELYSIPVPSLQLCRDHTDPAPRYEIATDEFEIATDSTTSATIYASSDRESARDALNQLLVVYALYTNDASSPEFQNVQREQEEKQTQKQKQGTEGEGKEASQIVTTNFNPGEVSSEAREEVRKRVGQRVRELRAAVEDLEERAKED